MMPRLSILALAALLCGMALPGAAQAAPEAGASVQLAQFAPPPPPPGFRPPPPPGVRPPPPPGFRPPPPRPRHCWTQTRRVVTYDRWGRPHARMVPYRVCR